MLSLPPPGTVHAGGQVGFDLILDDIIALLCVGQFFLRNGQLALRHIDGIELLGDVFLRIEPLQGIADIGILVVIFDLLQFHLPFIIGKDRCESCR